MYAVLFPLSADPVLPVDRPVSRGDMYSPFSSSPTSGRAAVLSLRAPFSDPGDQIIYMAGSTGRESLASIIDELAMKYSLSDAQKVEVTQVVLR